MLKDGSSRCTWRSHYSRNACQIIPPLLSSSHKQSPDPQPLPPDATEKSRSMRPERSQTINTQCRRRSGRTFAKQPDGEDQWIPGTGWGRDKLFIWCITKFNHFAIVLRIANATSDGTRKVAWAKIRSVRRSLSQLKKNSRHLVLSWAICNSGPHFLLYA